MKTDSENALNVKVSFHVTRKSLLQIHLQNRFELARRVVKLKEKCEAQHHEYCVGSNPAKYGFSS